MGSGASKTPNVKPKMTSSTYDVTAKKTEEEKMAEKHEMNVSNMYMLKRMFKQLDPVVMNSNGGVQGKVNVSIKYITEKSLLLVKIISARDLLTKDVRGASANPYIKVEMHSNENMEERATSVKQNTCNPIYNEVFMFPLNIQDSTKLRLSVWCHDALGEDDFMGEHVINVSELDCSDVITNKWLSLHPETDFFISGKINISMTYQSPQSLFIAVNDVTELRCKSRKPEISIRVYIPGVPYVFETKPASDVKMGDDVSADDVVSCEWKESFEFPVAKEELPSRYVVIVAHDVTNEYLGECHIDLDNFDCDVGYSGPFRLSDMRGNAMVRSRWSRNAVSSEFQDALLAHAQYKKPNFVFSRAGTNKAVSLRVPKAGAESRIRVVNGILVH